MARKARLSGSNLYHHIYAWGNDRQPVFKEKKHYEKYLKYLEFYGNRYDIDIIAYALMEWHIHLFVFDSSGKISNFMNRLHGQYAQFFNRLTNRVGHVFGERFNNKIVQVNNYGLWLSRYIHRQPVEAGIAKDPKDYSWTSYRAYIGLVPFGFLKPWVILDQFGKGKIALKHYENFVKGNDDDPIKWSKKTALVIGDEEFIKSQNVALLKEDNKAKEMDSEDLIRTISSELEIKPDILLNPHSWSQRRVRHKAFVILVDRYGLSATKVARMFNVSSMAVVKVLKNENQKV
ncbi:transposase [candidate division WOR-3 bacterium]|nr:transposase [candidate division WOR-3 bacterium]